MNHVKTWLEAYHDGELEPHRARRVETHLATCTSCRAELATIASLTALLHAVPPAQVRLTDVQFVAQVALQLPRRPTSAPGSKALRWSWIAAPALLLGLWGFVQATAIVAAGVTAMMTTELGRAIFGPAIDVGSSGTWLSSLLYAWELGTGAGLLENLPLNTIARWGVLNIGLPLLIALFIWSWLASWWAYQRHAAAQRSTSQTA